MIRLTQKSQQFLQKIAPLTDRYQINALAEELVTTSLNAEFCSLWYYDENEFQLIRHRGNGYLSSLDLSQKQGIIYKCFMTQESSVYNYLASDKDYVAALDNPDQIKIKSKVMVPLIDNGKLIGIVTAYNSIRYNKKFFKNDVMILEHLSPVLVEALHKMYGQQINTDVKVEDVDDTQDTSNDETLTFVANFVHDIRTPANSLYGFLDLLENQIEDERLKSYITNAKSSAEFINELTTSVLNLISTHKESVVSQVEEVDTVRFFSNIANSFASNMYEKNIYYNIYIDPKLPRTLEIDTLKMKRVILNLIGNAYKFTPKGRSIEFSAKYVAKTNRVVFYVKDTGIGIPKEKQKSIFEAFKQAEDTTALNYGGTGLGLFISAKYVQEMGGKLALVSEVDRGSTFSFDIPVKTSNPTPSLENIANDKIIVAFVMDSSNRFVANNIARYLVRMGIEKENIIPLSGFDMVDPNKITHLVVFQNKIDHYSMKSLASKGIEMVVIEEKFLSLSKEKLPVECPILPQYSCIGKGLYKFINQTKPPKVLIVDDDMISVTLLENILEGEMCSKEVARDGQEAFDKIIEAYHKQEPYDIIYIDNQMPRMNGNEVIEKVREYERKFDLQSIYIVSTSGDEINYYENKHNYNKFLGKPFKKEEVRRILKIYNKELN